MLSDLRGPGGRPNLRSRFAAVLVVLALVTFTAPIVLPPVVRVVGRLLF